MPIILICVLMLVVWIHYESNKTTDKSLAASEAFWKREQEANHTRNQDTDSLDYINVDLDRLPILETSSYQLSDLQNQLIRISKEKILNLSHLTNTELKLTYGTGKFAYLSQCDSNYICLMQTLEKLANYHLENNNHEFAIAFFEYAIECQSENSQTYVSLAKLYASSNCMSKLETLKTHLLQSNYSNKESILSKMEKAVLETFL